MTTRKLRILRVITWLPVGGIERRLVAVLPRIDRERFDVQLVCIRERGALADELEAAGIKVTCIPFKTRWDPFALRRLARFMRDEQIDLVHSHMYRSNVPATVAAKLAGIRRVWCQVHNVNTWETGRQLAMDRRLMRWRTGMIGVSERVREDIAHRLRISEDRVRVVYNGVEIGRFEAARALRGDVRAEHGAGGEHVVFLFAARLVNQKRAMDFLTAIGRLQAGPGGEKVQAWLLGDGPLRAELEAQAAALPRPEAVRFFGKRDDVERFMAGADVFVLPSTKEGFSNALVEAMATGLPIVATDVGGNAEAVRTGREGLIVPPMSPEPLFNAMRRMAEDAEFRRACAESALLRAREFTLDNMIQQVEALYTESCAS